ncbi:MAG: hemerythrin domain-containing protein [Actinomycetes bacterium]
MAHDPQADLIDELVADHREVEEAFSRLEAGMTPDEGHRLVEQTITELVRHSVVEEQLLYPLAARVLPDGRQLADHEKAEHAEVERMMKEIERLDPASQEFVTEVRMWMRSVRSHVEEEETDLMPRLRDAVPADELASLGEQARLLKRVTPTRPHPSTPNSPLAHATVGPLIGLVDRVRDAVSGRGRA